MAKVGSNIANVTTGNMGSVQMGTQVAAINTHRVQNMSGGRDALTGTHTIRKGVGAFTRTDIVPANNSYPKADGRLDCAGATCTYEEEMTNFSNWYAYYRTRMQMMKAAVGRAFVSVGASYRVGFITICPVSGNDCGTSSTGVSVVTEQVPEDRRLHRHAPGQLVRQALRHATRATSRRCAKRCRASD